MQAIRARKPAHRLQIQRLDRLRYVPAQYLSLREDGRPVHSGEKQDTQKSPHDTMRWIGSIHKGITLPRKRAIGNAETTTSKPAGYIFIDLHGYNGSLCHVANEVYAAVRVAPLVVVPAHELEKPAVQLD